jgi:serine/threonine protein kinase/Tol biopolymer transport system component
MKPEDLRQLETLFHRALEFEPGRRAAFLDQACAGDGSLRNRVEALLAAQAQAGSFMESPALDVEARMLAGDQHESLIGRRIGHHQIVALLGAGGMGEVYLAHDTRLGRKVALKLPPPLFTNDAERLRRFQREARAASALNHPNILTIYEIGQAEGRHFIATEYVDGLTLRQRMERTRMPLGEKLDVVFQVAGALAEAHAAGIIHRDVKPENIMLRVDGLAKVLDFGLAKLTDREAPAGTEGPTRALVNTEPGQIMGTVRYMSPEQVRGLEADGRTDVWSLGVVLYELLAGRNPFAGATTGDCIASILGREPAPLSHYFADAPEALQLIVKKALTKEKEDRYQTVRDMLNDLRLVKQRLEVGAESSRSTSAAGSREELQGGEEYRSSAETKLLSAGGAETPAGGTTTGGRSSAGETRNYRKGLLIVLVLTITAGVSFSLYKALFQTRPLSPSAPFRSMKINRLTTTGKTSDAAISPDGKYVVYVTEEDGRQSLWLRHLPTGSDKEIVALAELSYRALIFSHDSNYIYFVGSGNDKADDGLYKVTVLGGDMRRLSANVGSSASDITKVKSITLSPDDRQVAFQRRIEGSGESALIVMKTDGAGERKLLTRGAAERVGEPSWSPDGKTIVCSILNIPAEFTSRLTEVNVEDGRERQLPSQNRWYGYVGRLAWLDGGSGFVMTASDQPGAATQVWFVSYPGGQATRVTNDLNEYYNVSLSADSSTMVAAQSNTQMTLWVAPNADARRARPIMSGDNSINDVSWTPDNRILYNTMTGGKHTISLMDAGGKNRKQLAAVNVSITVSMTRDLRHVVFQTSEEGKFNIWRMDADGGNLKQLTEDGGVMPVLTPDDKWVVYFKLTPAGGQIRRVPIDGGEPVDVTGANVNAIAPIVSPDGKWIACSYSSPVYRAATPATAFRTAVLPIEGGEPVKVFDLLGGPENDFGWTADSRALTYIKTLGGVSNIWSRPLDDGRAKQLTDFKSEQIYSFDWSRDGKQLLILRGTPSSDAVIISDDERWSATLNGTE